MKFAHIFKASKSFRLVITSAPCIANAVIEELTFSSKAEAKAYAKQIGAKAWNY